MKKVIMSFAKWLQLKGVTIKKVYVGFAIIIMCIIVIPMIYNHRESSLLLRDVRNILDITNILSNYERLYDYGYSIDRGIDGVIRLSKGAFTETGNYFHIISINRRCLYSFDGDIEFDVSYSRLSNIWQIQDIFRHGIVHTHGLNVRSDCVTITLIELSSSRNPSSIFGQLDLIISIVNE